MKRVMLAVVGVGGKGAPAWRWRLPAQALRSPPTPRTRKIPPRPLALATSSGHQSVNAAFSSWQNDSDILHLQSTQRETRTTFVQKDLAGFDLAAVTPPE